jgi:hypothetical protein
VGNGNSLLSLHERPFIEEASNVSSGSVLDFGMSPRSSDNDYTIQLRFFASIFAFKSAKGLNVAADDVFPASERPAMSFNFECSCSWQ